MKRTVFFIMTVLSSFIMSGQEITGQWNGFLKVPGGQLALVFNISKSENGYTTTMDSPDQGARGIPVTATTFEKKTLKLEIPGARIVFEGELNQYNVIVGTFTQSGQSFPLNLSKEKLEKETLKRPQEPQKPYPYYTEDVTFENKTDKNVLAGTLSLPSKEGKFPVVILITGSGAQNRDEEILGHKPFLVLADYLTQKGIAVLRFDDRGTAKSTGDYKTATTFDFAKDVQAGIDYLKTRKEIDKSKIGLIGHSEGGIIAPIVAGNSKDVNFIVLLAGTGIRGDKLMLLQKEKIERLMAVSDGEIQKGQEVFKGVYKIIIDSPAGDPSLKSKVSSYLTLKVGDKMVDNQIKTLTAQITSPWMIGFLKLDPAVALEKVRCPVLAINGEKDMQVPADVNLEAIQKALAKGGNKNAAVKTLPNLNHLFQECKTGAPEEYAVIEQTFSPIALEEISKWILVRVK
ncbi:alpha/beta hydrolase family protein [Flavobacterium marginilacus]|uniref:alpha/beta hydrolase family protein n=1 Tax=Flavobacterium marginilacus TaxID=3003256 RepID=UPI00248EA640|nr:alpha/beta hydrolase [Flavobacterium marginilacus]